MRIAFCTGAAVMVAVLAGELTAQQPASAKPRVRNCHLEYWCPDDKKNRK